MTIIISASDKTSLRYLANAGRPLFGGHLERGEPLSPDSDIQRWLDLSLIEQVGTQGYVLTAKGHEALSDAETEKWQAIASQGIAIEHDLRIEIERLRAALQNIANGQAGDVPSRYARHALEGFQIKAPER